MKSVRIVANILFYLTRVAAIIYVITAVYTTAVVLLYVSGAAAPMNVENGAFEIYYPFTTAPFLLGDYTNSFLTMMILLISFYALFLWLLSNVFNTFRQTKLFTPAGVRRLSRFYVTNLTVPIISLIAAVLFYHDAVNDIAAISFLHIIIGVFAFFMAAIFKQGLVLQEEQDLTL
jgi:hypothetical protein